MTAPWPTPARHKLKKLAVKTLTLALTSACLVGALLLVAGCGQKTAKITSEQSKTFDSSPPEVKQTWEKALAADKAKDYVTAQAALDSLDKMILSDLQRKALEIEITAFGQRLTLAFEKKEPAAVNAIQTINQTRSQRN